jgi:hypothetical protein
VFSEYADMQRAWAILDCQPTQFDDVLHREVRVYSPDVLLVRAANFLPFIALRRGAPVNAALFSLIPYVNECED